MEEVGEVMGRGRVSKGVREGWQGYRGNGNGMLWKGGEKDEDGIRRQ